MESDLVDNRSACYYVHHNCLIMKKIVTIVDFSEMTDKVIRHTADLARQLNAEIILLYLTPAHSTLMVYDKMFKMSDNAFIRKVRSEKIKLQKIVKILERAGRPVSTRTIDGTHVTSMLQKLEDLNPDYLILGAQTRSWLDEKITGSHWTSIIASCRTPIIIIPKCSENKIGFSPEQLATIKIKRKRWS